MIDDKVKKAKNSSAQFFNGKSKTNADEPVIVNKPQVEEFVVCEGEELNMDLSEKQKMLEEQQRILEAQLQNIKQQMNLNLIQQMKATSWTVCNKTFNRIKGSEKESRI